MSTININKETLLSKKEQLLSQKEQEKLLEIRIEAEKIRIKNINDNNERKKRIADRETILSKYYEQEQIRIACNKSKEYSKEYYYFNVFEENPDLYEVICNL
jgi:hypothetical protein